MELLLVDDVPGLGVKGDLVTVARGYARNHLLPKGLAKTPSPQAVKEVRAAAAKREAERAAVKAERMDLAKELAGVAVTISMKAAEGGHLYGSVGTRQVAQALADAGYPLEEKQIHLDQPMKELGEYDVPIFLHPEVQVPVKVAVVSEEQPEE